MTTEASPSISWRSGSWVVGLLPGIDDSNMYSMTIIGRAFSAILDTGTVLVVFLIGRRLFSPKVGLLAAVFATFAVLHIQLSHFYTTDAMMTFFATLSFLYLIGVAQEGRRRDAALAGIFFGLALATKVSIAWMAPAFLAAPAIYALKTDGSSIEQWVFDKERLRVALRLLGITAGLAVLVFIVTQPHALLDIKHYAADTYSQSEMVRREIDFPFTRQYDNSLPFLYHIWQFSVWGVGAASGNPDVVGPCLHCHRSDEKASKGRPASLGLGTPLLPRHQPSRGQVPEVSPSHNSLPGHHGLPALLRDLGLG